MRWLVTGASGKLGGYLMRELSASGETVAGWSGSRPGSCSGVEMQRVDLADAEAIVAAYREAPPDVVIHAGALAAVSDCFRNPERAFKVNLAGTEQLLKLTDASGARLVFTSTDLVFEGENAPYGEDSPAKPLSVYGRSKRAAEEVVLAAGQVVLRLSLLFGPSITPTPSFFDDQIAALRNGKPVVLFEDEWRTPLSLRTAAQALVEIARSDFVGLLHVGGPERMSRLEMGKRLADWLGLDASGIRATQRSQATGEPRPRDVSLDSSLWRRSFPTQPWPAWTEAVRELDLSTSSSGKQPRK